MFSFNYCLLFAPLFWVSKTSAYLHGDVSSFLHSRGAFVQQSLRPSTLAMVMSEQEENKAPGPQPYLQQEPAEDTSMLQQQFEEQTPPTTSTTSVGAMPDNMPSAERAKLEQFAKLRMLESRLKKLQEELMGKEQNYQQRIRNVMEEME